MVDPRRSVFGPEAAEALEQLRAATSDARAARKDLLAELRRHRERVAELVHAEVEAQVERIAVDARVRLTSEVDRVVDGLAAELRRRLEL